MDDAPLYNRKRKYTRELHDVDLHENNKLHVISTSKARDMDKMVCKLRIKLAAMPVKRIGIDVGHTHYEDWEKAVVPQLCAKCECLVFHICAAKDRLERFSICTILSQSVV
ncbi:hypothetical protein ZWY2020_046541 [Hordeum vulgare]|nr:hypothetical protein ZWY2020_046541 [Hordeum vulgare]